MRSRLVAVLSVLSLLVVAAFAAPLLASTAQSRTSQFVLVRTADLDRLAWLAAGGGEGTGADASSALAEAVERHHALYGEAVLVVDALGRPRASAGLGPDPLAADGVSGAVDAALRDQAPPTPTRLTPWSSGPVLLWRPVGTGTAVEGAVVLRADPSLAAHDVRRSWGLVLLGSLLASAAAAGLALVLARWLLRPVQALAAGFADVTAGRSVAPLPGAGPPELRRLERSFTEMAAAVQESARRQRELVADVSHQIRNPLAALQLRIDALDGLVAPAAVPSYEGAVREVDRLADLLDGTLALATADAERTSSADPTADVATCDAVAVAAERVQAWQPAADAAGAVLLGPAVEGAPLLVAAPRREVAQVLDVLVDNAVHHGGRGCTVVVDVPPLLPGQAQVRVLVDDDGPGIPASERESAVQRSWRGPGSEERRGSGLGLAIAVRLVQTRRGELVLGGSPAGGLRAEVRLPLVVDAPEGPR
ncbi:MAG: HAMP domain-containing sensor histidine kinase [Quadrisphaera sp.]